MIQVSPSAFAKISIGELQRLAVGKQLDVDLAWTKEGALAARCRRMELCIGREDRFPDPVSCFKRRRSIPRSFIV